MDLSKFDIIGDAYYEIETGEYAGPVDGWLGDELKTEDDVILALRRLLKYETELKAEQLAMQSVIDRCKQLVAEKERKVYWLKNKYGDQIANFAESQLTGKAKTWKCPWGQVSFRTVPASFTIMDEQKAAMVIPESCEAVVQQFKVYKSKIPKEVQLTLVDEYPDIFCISVPTENVTIKSLTANDTEE